MLQKLQHHINHNFPFIKGKKILVALSGGVDSIVLSYLLHQLEFDIAVSHCNFQLRGTQADADQDFCKKWGEELQIPFHTINFDTQEYAEKHNLSIQMAARELRYNWFSKLLSENQYDFLTTAHHANDTLETFLINLSRGSGLKGLLGIPAHNQEIIRPLLIFSKEEIITFANENKLQWREDQSNTKDTYLRNHIRLNIVPELEKANPKILQNFEKTLQYLSENEKIIDNAIQVAKKNIIIHENEEEIVFSIEKLVDLEPLDSYLHHIFQEYGFHNLIDLKRLLVAENGKSLQNENFHLIKTQNQLFLVKSTTETTEVNIKIPNFVNHTLNLNQYFPENILQNIYYQENIIKIERSKLVFPLSIRPWQTEDSFQPLGMKGKKKLSKFLKDSKVPSHRRKDVYVILNGNEEIMVILGLRIDEKYKVTNEEFTIHF